MKKTRTATIKGITFDFTFSIRTLSYYMRKKRIGVAGGDGDNKLPSAMQTMGTFEIAEIYLVCMYLHFKDYTPAAILKTEVEDGERMIASVKVPTSLDPPTFGVPVMVTLDDVLIAMEEDSSLLGGFAESKNPGITIDAEGGDDAEMQKKQTSPSVM